MGPTMRLALIDVDGPNSITASAMYKAKQIGTGHHRRERSRR